MEQTDQYVAHDTILAGGLTNAGAVAASSSIHTRDASAASTSETCVDSVQSILNTALIVERLTVTFYYKALTTPAVLHNRSLGGPSADPNNPGLPPRRQPRAGTVPASGA